MCTRYISPTDREIEAVWKIDRRNNDTWPRRSLHPLSIGPFLRLNEDGQLEMVEGQWGMIPRESETRIPMSSPRPGEKAKRISTVNARSESVASRPTFRDAWKHGQRCIIPAASFDEPNWESGKNIWWRFARADGDPWGVAGLWSVWVDPVTGELVPNYTMLTINADAHPLMKRMHRPVLDPKTKQPLPPEQQDKRSLVLLEQQDFDQWLEGTSDAAKALLRLTPVEKFEAGPVPDEGLVANSAATQPLF